MQQRRSIKGNSNSFFGGHLELDSISSSSAFSLAGHSFNIISSIYNWEDKRDYVVVCCTLAILTSWSGCRGLRGEQRVCKEIWDIWVLSRSRSQWGGADWYFLRPPKNTWLRPRLLFYLYHLGINESGIKMYLLMGYSSDPIVSRKSAWRVIKMPKM